MADSSKSVEINGARISPRLDLNVAIQGGILLVLFSLIFAPTIPPLYNDWVTFDTFSHGLLVPFISAYLIWQKRSELLAATVRPTVWGMMLIVPALLLALVGKTIGDAFTERVALVLCFAGIVWLISGWELFKRLSFPLAYLFLMIPFPYVVVKEVAYRLRIVDAALAEPVLRVLGVPVFRDAYYLHLPDVTLEVADLCSGISSVFALLALGAAYVYFLPLKPRWKALAVISTLPFAAFINLLRIVLTAALAYYVSPAVLNVLIHKLTGTITFFIALLLFIALLEFMQRKLLPKTTVRSRLDPEASDIGSTATLDRPPAPQKSWLPLAVSLAAFIPALYFNFNAKAAAEVRLPFELTRLPLSLADFRATETGPAESYSDPNAEKDLRRRYSGSAGEIIEVYVGYRGSQLGDKRLRSPRLQFPFGWNFVWTEPARLAAKRGGTIDANWMLTQNNQRQVLVLYWYQSGDKTLAGETENRLQLVRRAILERRTDGAIVRLATPIVETEKIDQAKKRLAAFATALYPEMLRILPQ